MIELIFVIVIIGILAAVAIPKLAATRDDAKISKALANLKTCINDVGAGYTARGEEIFDSAACAQVVTDACFAMDDNGSTVDGNITAGPGTNTELWCTDAKTEAGTQGLTAADGAILTHVFGGSRVIR